MTIRAIGGELGFVEACIPTQARVRVVINGLNPLEMIRDISLPSGETTEVEFDYEKLEKHCFKCFSLSHEKAECPVSTGPCEENGNPERLGISQNNTMARLDDKRRRYEERRKDKAPLTQKPRDSSTLYTRRNESDDRRSEQRYNSRHQLNYSPVTSEYRRGREEHRRERSFYRAPDDRTGSRSSLHISGRVAGYLDTRRKEDDKSADRAAKERGHSHDSGSKTIQSPALPEVVPHSSDLRRTLPRREQEEDFAPQVSSDRRPTRNRLSSIAAPHSSDLRLSLVQKSADRLPVKERLSLPSNGKQKLVQQGNSTGSSKLQDIEIQYLEEIMEPPRQESISRPSGSRLHGIPRSPTDEESPIRTLSEDRRHVSLRLGPLSASSPSDLPVHSRLSEGPEIITRSVAKKRAGTVTQSKRINSSPLQGISLKKRRITKAQNSPLRRTPARNTSGKSAAPAQKQVPPSGTSGGLALSWKTDTQLDILSSSSNFIDTAITLQQKPMFVTFIYGAPRSENRADFWNSLTKVGFEGSDHRPVLVHLNQSAKKKRGLFRFDRRLRDKPEIKELVEEHWTSVSYESVFSKICRIRRKLMEWSKLQNRNSKEAILESQSKLEEALSCSVPDPIDIAVLSEKLEKAYLEEEQFWRQRSRILWLHSGDRNSGFFHAVTRERRTINKFSVIEDANGQAVFEEDQIVKTISDYYNDLFSSRQPTSLQVVDECDVL
ncbi:hypothetical protein Bca52824_017683 [Brassica carinata]|uniref:Zinc knuckle CX2CX4HX4C domain-containing protein n=1 Tax=Brassica carinata TaxID=52824 RepID=A0A8X7VNI5_BRACI|nr:hypothetical protein Bca52824_017683 [Brassica carinata]